ncbi:Two-component transcriptional response regulator, LuxR family [hydrothermal vent metagenome]|uniref:Two-component transcriptional response regulator, LuxR family n=1 Tax=hydrothermal vent metagenome TaxID=652676 RepID=A0A3B0TLT1_9ZZZZ
MTKKIRMIVVDDHPLYRDGVVRTLHDSGLIDVVGAGADCASAVKLGVDLCPDVALVDISMPGGGLEALSQLVAKQPDTKVIMLTVSESDNDVLSALNSGASGYVLKGVSGSQLIEIVTSVAAGGSYVSPQLAARVLVAMQEGGSDPKRSVVEDLTRREEQILRLVSKGKSNKEVAIELDLQEKTIKHHMTSILQKLKVRNRVEAAVLAKDIWT